MKLHFAASTHADSQSRLAQLTKRYGQFDVEVADIIVVLGGDGQMLQAMRDSIQQNLPLFGMNCGRVGFLMNEFSADELLERIAAADRAEVHPLRMSATTVSTVFETEVTPLAFIEKTSSEYSLTFPFSSLSTCEFSAALT